jgi:CBS domain-containing protein
VRCFRLFATRLRLECHAARSILLSAHDQLPRSGKAMRVRLTDRFIESAAPNGRRIWVRRAGRPSGCQFFRSDRAISATAGWVSPETPVTELPKLMCDHDIGAIPIRENDRLIGMVTDRDIVCKGLAQEGFDARRATARQVMTAGDSQHITVMGDGKRLMHVLLDKEYCDPAVIDPADDVEVLPDQERRQAERRLVDQQQLRRPHQAPSARDHGLLAARHGAGERRPPLGQATQVSSSARSRWIDPCVDRAAAVDGERRRAQRTAVRLSGVGLKRAPEAFRKGIG